MVHSGRRVIRGDEVAASRLRLRPNPHTSRPPVARAEGRTIDRAAASLVCSSTGRGLREGRAFALWQSDRVIIRVPLPAAALVTLTVALTGCATTGPMQMGSGSSSDTSIVCIPQVSDPAIGGERISVAGTDSVVINEVSLVGASNVVLEDAYLIPIINGEGGVGATNSPPSDLPGWERAINAVGATIEPGVDTSLAVVMHRLDSAAAGSADRVEISYSAAGRTHTKQNSTRFELNTRCK